MNAGARASLLALLAAGSLACDDDGIQVSRGGLAGTWVATSALFTSVADTTVTFDPIVEDDATLTLVIRSDDTATLTTVLDGVTEVDDGTIAVDGAMITLDFGGEPTTGTFDRSGDRLDITLETEVSFDFGAGEEPATLDLELVRS